MWLDEALDDRRREAIKIRSRPRPLRPGEAADGAVSKTLKPTLSKPQLPPSTPLLPANLAPTGITPSSLWSLWSLSPTDQDRTPWASEVTAVPLSWLGEPDQPQDPNSQTRRNPLALSGCLAAVWPAAAGAARVHF